MPLFAILLSGLLGGLASFFAKFVTRKVAVVGAALTYLGTITLAAVASFNLIVSPLVASAFNTQYGQLIGLAFPPAAGTCLAAIATSWAACAVYKWQLQALKISVQA